MVTNTDAVVDSARFRLTKPTTDPAFIRFRIQEGIADHIRYVEGRAPTATVDTKDGVGPESLNDVPVYETGVAADTAKRFGLAVGDEIQLLGDPGDPLLGRTPSDVYAYARITGIYDVPSPADDYWFGDPLPIHPVIRALSLETQLLDGVLLVDPAVHERLAQEARNIEKSLGYSWRYTLATDRITAGNAPGLAMAFRRLNVRYPSPNITPANDVALRTGLLPLLDGFGASWAAAQSIVAVTALGPALVAIATLALIAILAARRRRATMALARSRGATARQVVWPVVLEGLLRRRPGGGDRGRGGDRARRRRLGPALRRRRGGRRRRGRRRARRDGGADRPLHRAPSATPATARPGAPAAGGWCWRRCWSASPSGPRGCCESGGSPRRPRPPRAGLRASTRSSPRCPRWSGSRPGIVAVRLFPLVMRAAAAIGRRRRGLVALLATRRAADGGAGSAVLLVLLATATVGAFGAVSLDNLDRGADLAAWQAVGADYRIEAPNGGLPASLDPAALPGAEAVASEYRGAVEINLIGAQVLYAAVEGAKLREVLAGTRAAPDLPAGFAEPSNGPIPAIISREVAESARGVKLGDTFNLSVQGFNLPYVAAAVVDDFPGLPSGRGFVIAAREQFLARAPQARLVPTDLLVRAPASDAAALRQHVARVAPSIIVTSQAEDAAARRASPVTGAVRSLVLVAALVTAAYAAIGVAAALALAGLARTQETAQLRTLGLTGRQSAALLLAEHGPVTLAAFVAGGLLGATLFALLRPAMGIGSLVGASIDVPVVLEPALLLVILVAMTVVVGFGLWLGAVLQRRVAPVSAIRGRFE